MLKLKNISYSVSDKKSKTEILKKIDFTFEDGLTYAITGPNGSGKSTLAKIIMGVIKPTSGEINYNGKNITALSPTDRANLGLSFAFQSPVRFKGLTVKDILELASGKENNLTETCHYLSAVGLCARDYLDRELDNKLSGGELKRIEIATALARNAALNIFDEPEAGIDIWSFDALVDIFSSLKNKKATNIIVSHQEKLLKKADVVIVLDNGNITKAGKPEEVLSTLAPSYCNKLRRND
ncbi:MAG: ATP-binding cassette domain-containing protein [bacterium]|nr:ATP-binding cassette domain-containing protein [bacterium]